MTENFILVEISILIYLLFLVIVGWALPTFPPGYHHPIGHTNLNSLPSPQMPDYRGTNTLGGAIFFTLATFNRRPIFAEPDNIKRLRQAAATVKSDLP